jgi:hypothetical protein
VYDYHRQVYENNETGQAYKETDRLEVMILTVPVKACAELVIDPIGNHF